MDKNDGEHRGYSKELLETDERVQTEEVPYENNKNMDMFRSNVLMETEEEEKLEPVNQV